MKRNSKLIVGGIAIIVLAAGGYALYDIGMNRGMRMADARSGDNPVTDTPASMAASDGTIRTGDIDPATGKEVLYWHDPMVPGQRFDQPGKSPFMDMMLVPVYADRNDGDGGVAVSPRMQQNLGVRTVEVRRGPMTAQVEAAGNVAFNERDQVVVQARATAYIERLHVRATLDPVVAGQALVELYVPEWVAEQEEFLSLRRMRGTDLAVLVDAARRRMIQVGMSDAQIRRVEASGAVQPRITLTAPIGGVVVELGAREGMTVMPGDTLFRINGLETVWANAEVPESQARFLGPGTSVEARSPAVPSVVFAGSVQAVLPEVDPMTRTIKVRIELANPDRRLVPGMFVGIAFAAPAADALIVPTEAVIQTGRRTVVIVAEADGSFRPVDIEIGMESNGRSEVTRGLEAGRNVVASGQFLIDSEASLRATSMRMEEMPPAEAASEQTQP
jgi:Cu(I)/Ag(I) efflux system membrane fusion protein